MSKGVKLRIDGRRNPALLSFLHDPFINWSPLLGFLMGCFLSSLKNGPLREEIE